MRDKMFEYLLLLSIWVLYNSNRSKNKCSVHKCMTNHMIKKNRIDFDIVFVVVVLVVNGKSISLSLLSLISPRNLLTCTQKNIHLVSMCRVGRIY